MFQQLLRLTFLPTLEQVWRAPALTRLVPEDALLAAQFPVWIVV